MRVILSGGGTAGHVNPAVAIAEIIRNREKNSEFLFIGRMGGDENSSVKKANIPIKTLKVYGLKRSLSISNIKTIYVAYRAKKDAKEIIKEFKPDLVIGTGGYVCLPVLLAARSLGIKTVIHESNAYPGLVTRMLAKRCELVLLGLDGANGYLSKKANSITVGNPVRADFENLTREQARKNLNISKNDIFIVSFGGSLGADALNNAMLDFISKHSIKNFKIKHIHSVGKRYYAKIKKDYPELCGKNSRISVVDYIENMPRVLPAADIAITRSGAITLTELSHAGVASVLVPSDVVAGNHQYKNARYIEEQGGAVLVTEDDIKSGRFEKEIQELINNKKKRQQLAANISKLTEKNTSEMIYTQLCKLIR